MPKVQFVIRTKNEEVWLERVLKKLYSQTITDFEITIVDSGSTDKTLQIIAKFPQIHLIQIPQSEFGYSFALNLGIQSSDSEYIAIISGHSLPFSNTWLQSGIDHLERDANIAAVTGHYTDLPDAPIIKRIQDFLSFRKWEKQDHWKFLTNTNSLIRRSCWEKYPFDETLYECENYDWALEMLSRGYNIFLEPKFRVYHSHFHIPNAKTFDERIVEWKKIMKEIDLRRGK
jgi:rhamnosyltransferase